jgi:hypothetical protein
MSQNNPFAKLGALDQMLYQETTPTRKKDEVEKPVDKQPKEKPAETNLLANQQTSKPAKKQTSKPTNQQTSKEAKKQTNLLANQQTSEIPLSTKDKKKYGTYLREDSILDIQVHAIQTKRKDHEVLQEAVDFYFANKKK